MFTICLFLFSFEGFENLGLAPKNKNLAQISGLDLLTLYVTKRATPDTCLEIAFLTTRVRAPDTDDWEKLCHLMEYLRGNHDQHLSLGDDNDRL